MEMSEDINIHHPLQEQQKSALRVVPTRYVEVAEESDKSFQLIKHPSLVRIIEEIEVSLITSLLIYLFTLHLHTQLVHYLTLKWSLGKYVV